MKRMIKAPAIFLTSIALFIISMMTILYSCGTPENSSKTNNTSSDNSVITSKESMSMELSKVLPAGNNKFTIIDNNGDTLTVTKRDSIVTMSYSYTIPITDTTWKRKSVIDTTIGGTNKPPVVNAGVDKTIILPVNSLILAGSASDPDGSISSYLWSKVSGGSANIVSSTQASTNITGLVSGNYIFRLTVTDNKSATASDDVLVTVNTASGDSTLIFAYQGFGADAVGGFNSSTVYHVTNLNASGSGSLANGIGSNRTILFDVSGTINASFDIANISYMTIDAVGRDITLNGNAGKNQSGDVFSFDGAKTHHCILKNIHVTNGGGDGINVVDGANNILISNCTSWSNRDGDIDIAGDTKGITNHITVQWCITGGGTGADYSGEMLITGQSVTSHHNLYVPSGVVGERCPLVHCNYSPVGSPNADIVNNVVWRFGRNNGTGSGYGTDIAYGATANVVNNYYYSPSDGGDAVVTNGSYGSTPKGVAYVSGNVSGNSGVNPNSANNSAKFAIPVQYSVTTQDACIAAALVLQYAGPQGASRNSVDKGFLSISLLNCK